MKEQHIESALFDSEQQTLRPFNVWAHFSPARQPEIHRPLWHSSHPAQSVFWAQCFWAGLMALDTFSFKSRLNSKDIWLLDPQMKACGVLRRPLM